MFSLNPVYKPIPALTDISDPSARNTETGLAVVRKSKFVP